MLAGCSRDPNVRKQRYLESGEKYMAKAKYREASIQFLNALHLDPRFAEAHYQLAECDFKLGLLREGFVELQRAVLFQPGNLRARLELGQLLLAAGQYTKAIEQADRVLAKEPDNADAHILKAAIDTGMKRVDDAVSELNTAVQIDPGRSSSFANLATLESLRPQQSAEAEANFKKSIELDPKSTSVRMNLASFYDASKRFSDGERILRDALALAPKDQTLYSALVHHYLVQKNEVAAEQAAKQAKESLSPDPTGAQFLAKYYLLINDMASALQEYERLAQDYPKELEIQHGYLNLVMALNRTGDAWPEIGIILKRAPRDEGALLAKATLLIGEGKAAEARDALQQVVKYDSDNLVAKYQLGVALDMLGKSDEAEMQWTDVARLQPRHLPAQKALAKAALSNGDSAALSSIAATLIEKVPNAPEGYQFRAQADILQGNPRDAEAQLQKAISLAPHSIAPYIDLGRVYILEKRNAEAEKTLSHVVDVDPQQVDALSSLAELYLSNKQPDKALAMAQRSSTQFPKNTDLHVLLAELAGSQSNLELAESELTRARDLEPSPRVYSMLAGVQNQRGESAKLHATLDAAVHDNPKDAEAYWMRGTVYDRENETLEAENDYRKALELRPDFPLAANNLAFLLVQNAGNIDEAITFAELARRKMPASSTVADTLGWAYYQKGLAGLAIEALRDAVQKDPTNASFHYHLGMAYSKNGSREHAREELQRALELESNDARKDEIRKGLSELG